MLLVVMLMVLDPFFALGSGRITGNSEARCGKAGDSASSRLYSTKPPREHYGVLSPPLPFVARVGVKISPAVAVSQRS